MIREATLQDVPLLRSLTEQLGYTIPISQMEENVRIYLQDPEKFLFVAVFEEDVVGYIALDIAQTFHRKGKHMRVVSLVVDSAKRGQGIGTFLLQEAERVAKQERCWAIELTSSARREKEGTHDFYVGQGYEKNGSQAYFRKILEE